MQVFQLTEFQKQERAMQRWNEMNQTWDRMKKRVATKLGKV